MPKTKEEKKLKRGTILTLCFLLMASILTVIPAMAEKEGVEFKANGKLTHYGVLGPPLGSCKILRGGWDVKIKDGQVDFKFFYHELNIDEDVEFSPEGTVDHFRGYLDKGTFVFVVDEGYYEISGVMHVDKKMWFLDEYEPPPDWPDPPEHAPIRWLENYMVTKDAIVRIKPDVIEIGSVIGGMSKFGVTLNYHDSLFYGE